MKEKKINDARAEQNEVVFPSPNQPATADRADRALHENPRRRLAHLNVSNVIAYHLNHDGRNEDY